MNLFCINLSIYLSISLDFDSFMPFCQRVEKSVFVWALVLNSEHCTFTARDLTYTHFLIYAKDMV
jgi:hypothetical protein